MSEKTKTDYFTFPPVRSKVLTLCEQDANHYAEAEEPLLLWMPDFRDLDFKGHGESWLLQQGTTPRNIDPSQYAPGAERYRQGFQFRAGMISTPGIILGSRHTGTSEGRAFLARLLESGAIKKVGVIEENGAWREYKLTLEGADLFFGTLAQVYANCVHPLNEMGDATSLKAGRYFMTCGSLTVSRGSMHSVGSGWFIPESCIENPNGLIEGGRVIFAGSMRDDFSDIELEPHVAALYRAIATIEEDCRLSNTPRTESQEKYVSDLFIQAVEAGRGVSVCG